MSNKTFLDYCKEILCEREETVLRLRFGVDKPPMTLEQVGDEFSVTRERIRHICVVALDKIRKADLDIWNDVYKYIENGFILRKDAHTFDPDIDDSTFMRIYHCIHGEESFFSHKDLRHTWVIAYKNDDMNKALESIRKFFRVNPVDWKVENLVSYFDEGSTDLIRKIFTDLTYFNEERGTISSLMPFEDRFKYFVKKSCGIVTIKEIMDYFCISQNKAYSLIRKCSYLRIGKILCHTEEKSDSILVGLVEALYQTKKPLSIDKDNLCTLGMMSGFSKQESIDEINKLIDLRSDIFTRVNDKITLTETY